MKWKVNGLHLEIYLFANNKCMFAYVKGCNTATSHPSNAWTTFSLSHCTRCYELLRWFIFSWKRVQPHEQRFHWAIEFFVIGFFFFLEIFALPRNLGLYNVQLYMTQGFQSKKRDLDGYRLPAWEETYSHFLRRGIFSMVAFFHCVFSHEQQQWFSCQINSNSFTTCLFFVCLSAQMLDCLPYKSLTPVSPFVFCLPAQMEHDLHFVGFAFSDSGSGLVSTLSEGGWIVEVTFSVLSFQIASRIKFDAHLLQVFILCCWRTW